MNSEPSKPTERDLFLAAADLPPAERAAFLDRACGADTALRAGVEALLKNHAADSFMEPPSPPRGPSGTVVMPVTEKVGDRIGRYKLLQLIGEGGCGVVYMAEQSEPVRRKVALKVIKLGMDTKNVIARFEAERQALAMMDHSNIAKVFDAGATDTGRPFFVMELVRGVPITTYCDEANLPTVERLDLFAKVCHAIQHAHQKGIIHRDIKPSNILVTLHDGVPVPKVIDFGIAKATDQNLTDKTLFTELHAFMGTPAYTSPEQAEMSGLDIDTRADIYSLGVLLYELLTGNPPFDQETLLKAGLDGMRRTLREVEPPRPSMRLSTLSGADLSAVGKQRGIEGAKLSSLIRGDLDWIVMKALEKDRTRRYESASSFADDIRRYRTNEAVVARPPSPSYLFWKWAGRNQSTFFVLATATACLVTMVLGLSVNTYRARQSQRVAEAARRSAETAAARSQQVASFMQAMLEGVGPSVALGRDTAMLREILDKTTARLAADLKEQPEVAAELRGTLGRVYLDLGEYASAELLLKDALEASRKLHGSRHVKVAGLLRQLAAVALLQGQPSRAETLARESLDICASLPADQTATVAEAQHVLAMVLSRQNRLTEAESLHREAVAGFRQPSATGAGLAAALTELAYNQHLQGRLPESEALYREALALQKKLLGAEHPKLTVILLSLGGVLEPQGKGAEAETLYRECLALQTKLLGPDHPRLATTLGTLARLLQQRGNTAEARRLQEQYDALRARLIGNPDLARAQKQVESGVTLLQQGKGAAAEAAFRPALAAFRTHQGSDNPVTLSILGPLAVALGQQQRWEEAATLHREALAAWQRLGSGTQPAAAQTRFDLALVLQRQGKFAEAEPLLREALALFKPTLGPEHRSVAVTLLELARVLDLQGKSVAREPVLRELLALGEKLQADNWQTFDVRSQLGGSLLAQRKYSDAEPFLVSGYSGLQQREARIPAASRSALKDALTRLVQLYMDWGKPGPAAEWQARLDQLKNTP
jgi:serine/threonine protein kinase